MKIETYVDTTHEDRLGIIKLLYNLHNDGWKQIDKFIHVETTKKVDEDEAPPTDMLICVFPLIKKVFVITYIKDEYCE